MAKFPSKYRRNRIPIILSFEQNPPSPLPQPPSVVVYSGTAHIQRYKKPQRQRRAKIFVPYQSFKSKNNFTTQTWNQLKILLLLWNKPMLCQPLLPPLPLYSRSIPLNQQQNPNPSTPAPLHSPLLPHTTSTPSSSASSLASPSPSSTSPSAPPSGSSSIAR